MTVSRLKEICWWFVSPEPYNPFEPKLRLKESGLINAE